MSDRPELGAPAGARSMQGETGADVERPLAAALAEQIELAERVAAIASRQGPMLASPHPEAVLDLIEEREPLVARMEALAAEVRALTEVVGGAAGMGRLGRDRLVGQVGRLAELLEVIRGLDEADHRAMEEKRDELAIELASLERGRAAMGAYGSEGTGAGGAALQDREG